MIRAFLDANVLFRAALAARSEKHASWGIIALAGRRDDLTVMTTEYAFYEAENKLREKSPTSLGEYANIKPMLEALPEPPDELTAHVRRLIQDEKDRPILAGAIYAEADWLLTWDYNHFGHLFGITVYDVLITTPATGVFRFEQLGGML